MEKFADHCFAFQDKSNKADKRVGGDGRGWRVQASPRRKALFFSHEVSCHNPVPHSQTPKSPPGEQLENGPKTELRNSRDWAFLPREPCDYLKGLWHYFTEHSFSDTKGWRFMRKSRSVTGKEITFASHNLSCTTHPLIYRLWDWMGTPLYRWGNSERLLW